MEEGEAAAAEIPDGDGEQLRSKRPKLRNMTNRAREPGTVFTNFTLVRFLIGKLELPLSMLPLSKGGLDLGRNFCALGRVSRVTLAPFRFNTLLS